MRTVVAKETMSAAREIDEVCQPRARAEGSVIDCDGYVGISRQLNAHLLCARCAKVKCSVDSG